MTPPGVLTTVKRAWGESVRQLTVGDLPSDTFRVATVKFSIKPLVASHASAFGCDVSLTTNWRTSASVSASGGSVIFSASTSGPAAFGAAAAVGTLTGAAAIGGTVALRGRRTT